MKPLLIFEGVDGAGKTTLAREVARRIGAMYVHHGAYAPLRGDQIARAYHLSMLPALYDVAPVVMDRSWFSEPIYGEVFRSGHDRVLVGWRRMLERVALTAPSLVVHLRVPFEVAWSTVEARPSAELAKRREQLERVFAGYERFTRWPSRSLDLPRGSKTTAELADEVLSALPPPELPRISQADLATRLGVIGNVRAASEAALLVGDRRSEDGSSSWMPFVNYTLGGCSAWLAELLERHAVPEERLVWVNAFTTDDVATPLADVVTTLRPRGVIALGQRAAEALRSQGVEHREVPHPQFVKRFHHHEADGYALLSALKELT